MFCSKMTPPLGLYSVLTLARTHILLLRALYWDLTVHGLSGNVMMIHSLVSLCVLGRLCAVTLLLSAEPEIKYVALRNIDLIIQKQPAVLDNELKVCTCETSCFQMEIHDSANVRKRNV